MGLTIRSAAELQEQLRNPQSPLSKKIFAIQFFIAKGLKQYQQLLIFLMYVRLLEAELNKIKEQHTLRYETNDHLPIIIFNSFNSSYFSYMLAQQIMQLSNTIQNVLNHLKRLTSCFDDAIENELYAAFTTVFAELENPPTEKQIMQQIAVTQAALRHLAKTEIDHLFPDTDDPQAFLKFLNKLNGQAQNNIVETTPLTSNTLQPTPFATADEEELPQAFAQAVNLSNHNQTQNPLYYLIPDMIPASRRALLREDMENIFYDNIFSLAQRQGHRLNASSVRSMLDTNCLETTFMLTLQAACYNYLEVGFSTLAVAVQQPNHFTNNHQIAHLAASFAQTHGRVFPPLNQSCGHQFINQANQQPQNNNPFERHRLI